MHSRVSHHVFPGGAQAGGSVAMVMAMSMRCEAGQGEEGERESNLLRDDETKTCAQIVNTHVR